MEGREMIKRWRQGDNDKEKEVTKKERKQRREMEGGKEMMKRDGGKEIMKNRRGREMKMGGVETRKGDYEGR